MKKKVLAVLMAATMVVGLAACGSKEEAEPTPAPVAEPILVQEEKQEEVEVVEEVQVQDEKKELPAFMKRLFGKK